jgi:hypothetical protein
MSNDKVVIGSGVPESHPPVKESIKGEDVHKFLKCFGNGTFGCAYFGVTSKHEGPYPSGAYDLQSFVLGKLLTWADSSFDERRAEAVKSIFKDIIHQAFNRDRVNFEKGATKLLK